MIVAKIIARVDRRRPIEVTDLVRPELPCADFARSCGWRAGRDATIKSTVIIHLYLKVWVAPAGMGLCFGRHGWGVRGWLARPTVE